jgi:Ras GTPase-activating-like protein IQGAP2/3
VNDIVRGHPIYINIAVHYIRPRQVTYVKDAYQSIIREVIDSADLDLEVDPSVVSLQSICIISEPAQYNVRFIERG